MCKYWVHLCHVTLKDGIPALLALTAAVVNELGDGGARGSSPHAHPVVAIVR